MLFGVPDEIPDVTRSFGMVRRQLIIYRKCCFGHRDKFRGYRYCTGTTGVSRGSTGWGHLPRGATWALGGAPWPTWAKGNQPQEAHAPRVPKGKSPTSGRHLLGALGGRKSSLAAAPLGTSDLPGPATPQEAYIKGGGEGGSRTLCLGAS